MCQIWRYVEADPDKASVHIGTYHLEQKNKYNETAATNSLIIKLLLELICQLLHSEAQWKLAAIVDFYHRSSTFDTRE